MLNPLLLMVIPAFSSPMLNIADDDMPELALGAKKESTIIRRLNSTSSIARIKAASELGEFKVRGSVAHLINKLKDSNPQVRAEVVRALGLLKVNRVAKTIYGLLLQDPSPLVRAKAAVALGEMGYLDAKEAIVSLLDRPDIRERIAAVKALGKLGGPKMFRLLIGKLNSVSSELKEAVLYSLGEVNNKRGVSRVVRYLDDKNPNIQKAALVALTTLDPLAVRLRLNQFLLKNGVDFKLVVLESITRIGCSNCLENLKMLIEKGKDDISGAAASTAAYLNLETLGSSILARLRRNPTLHSKIRYLWSLGRLGRMEILPDTYSFLNSRVPEMRLVALRVLRLLRPRDPELPSKVSPFIYDSELSVAAEAYMLLSEYGDKSFFNRKKIGRITSPTIIAAVSYGIPWIGKPKKRTINILRKWLNHEKYFVKCSAVRALGILKESSAVPKLLAFLYHQNFFLKKSSIIALAMNGDRDSRGPLKYVISKDRNPEIKALAWLAYSLNGLNRDASKKVINLFSESMAEKNLKIAFIYALVFAKTSKKIDEIRFNKIFYALFHKGYNDKTKADLLEILLVHGQNWAADWLEKAAKSPLYRVKSKALLWLARYRQPLRLQQLPVKKVETGVLSSPKKSVSLKLPFSSEQEEEKSGCGCSISGKPKDIVVFFPMVLFLLAIRFRYRKYS
jgi:HEAT repeat protein